MQAEQKAKRVEKEQKLKAQKEQSKKSKPIAVTKESTSSDSTSSSLPTTTDNTNKKTALPAMLPMDILESVAKMDTSVSGGSANNDKKRKHMRPEDFALMELERELREEAQKRKKAEKTQKNVG